MHPGEKPNSSLHIFLYLLGIIFLFAACAPTTGPVVAPAPNPELDELRHENAQLKLELSEKEQVMAGMQLKLLEKHAEVNRLTSMNEQLINEFVRNKSTTRNRGDKAETARLIAEVDTLINTLKSGSTTSHHDVLGRAEKYLADSKSELDVGNIDGSFYLASQALELVQEAQLIAEAASQNSKGVFITFSVPLPMKLVETSNVRSGPSLEDKVLFVLGKGKAVRAVGYQRQWIKVLIKGRGSGWIHSSLLH